MQEITAGRAIVQVLKAEGVRAVFGLPGGHTLPIYDALYDTPEVRHVLVRHEQIAANMAAGYAQLTGEPGVCCVTAGPGATNLASGIAEAFVGALPIVVLAGRGATSTAHRGASQEISQIDLFRPITKWAVRVDRADLVVEVLRQAFTVAKCGKPGPVLVDLPRDVLSQTVTPRVYRPTGQSPRVRPDDTLLREAADALARAKRPLLVAGGGALAAGAADEVRALAEALLAPVVTTLAGRGALPDDHPLAAGGLGHHRTTLTKRLLPDADVVLSIGARFEEQETNWQQSYLPAPEACCIQIDIDPAELGRSVVPHIGIAGDAKLALRDLLCHLQQHDGTARASVMQSRLEQITAERERIEGEADRLAASMQRPIHPMRAIRIARDVFPRESIVAFDVGVLAQGMAGAFPYFKIYEPRSTIVPSSFYGMGFSASALPVARLIHPDRPALGFVGDGSFQMVMNVLPTAAELRLPVTWLVLNDCALGSIWDGQQAAFGGRTIATTFNVQPDFAAIATACGCHGERVDEPGRLREAMKRALDANARGRPAVLDIVVAKERLSGSVEFFAKK